MLTISDVPDKKASAIIEKLGAIDFSDDPYHRIIVLAAKKLIGIGLGDYTYDTQYASGTTVWGRDGFSPIVVKPDGMIF